uniref:Uncharacterized protein n=1 Tax=Anguilla anguilla TaxID=7936 RepID=A0A0E9P6P7_ANGAN
MTVFDGVLCFMCVMVCYCAKGVVWCSGQISVKGEVNHFLNPFVRAPKWPG